MVEKIFVREEKLKKLASGTLKTLFLFKLKIELVQKLGENQD